MKKKILFGLLSTVLALPAFAALKEGDIAPDFNIPASFAGKSSDFSLKEHLKKGPVVVYFYPSAYTRGCNIQAHTFSTKAEEFKAAGATIIGVSQDSVKRLNEFSADPEFCAGKIAVGSDSEARVAKAFNLDIKPAAEGKLDTRGVAIDHGFTERTTFIVTQDGKIAATIGGVAPADNVEQALAAVKKLSSDKKS